MKTLTQSSFRMPMAEHGDRLWLRGLHKSSPNKAYENEVIQIFDSMRRFGRRRLTEAGKPRADVCSNIQVSH